MNNFAYNLGANMVKRSAGSYVDQVKQQGPPEPMFRKATPYKDMAGGLMSQGMGIASAANPFTMHQSQNMMNIGKNLFSRGRKDFNNTGAGYTYNTLDMGTTLDAAKNVFNPFSSFSKKVEGLGDLGTAQYRAAKGIGGELENKLGLGTAAKGLFNLTPGGMLFGGGPSKGMKQLQDAANTIKNTITQNEMNKHFGKSTYGKTPYHQARGGGTSKPDQYYRPRAV